MAARSDGLWLGLILLVGFAVRFGLALAFPNMHRPDEVFENLEPAFRMVFHQGVVTWEWHEGIRSPMFPGFLAGLIGLSVQMGLSARGYLAVIAGVLSLISLAPIAIAFVLSPREAGLWGRVVCGTLCAVWPDLVYFGPKSLGEVQAGNLLVIAAFLAGTAGRDGSGTRLRLAGVGVLLGLVFCIRFHLAPALLLVAAVACGLDVRRRWLPLVLGGLVPVLAMGLVDLYFWGSLFKSVWRNVQINVSEGISQEFGVQPVYWYGGKILAEWGAAIVPIGVAFLLGVRRAPLLAGVAAVVILSHSLIAHKELTFIYAAIPPITVVAGLGTVESVAWLMRQRGPGPIRRVMVGAAAFWLATSLATAVSGEYRRHWRAHAGVLSAEIAMRTDPALCGLGLRWPAVRWFLSGGDSYLGRGVPIYAFGSRDGVARVAPAINYAIGGSDVAEGLPGFSVARCWAGDDGPICMARSERQSCVPDPGFELNSVPNLGRASTQAGADTP